ncbi:MAG: dTDP-4-dehydrorhamnose reductase [Cyclobacteriaceae bacterium]
MKILVTGSNGQLGSELQAIAKSSDWEFIFTDYQELDITDRDAVLKFFEENKPDYCINCAAYTAVDKAESEKQKADLINVSGAENLALGCAKLEAKFFQISTDFVFDGTASAPLKEDKTTTPVNYYGESKLKGEIAVAEHLKEHFIFRTSWLYSTFGNNFVKTMLKLSETKDELNIIADQIGTPTYARDLANAIVEIIKSGSTAYGLYHYSNEGVASWYDFTKAIFEYAQVDTKVNPIRTSQYPTPAARPAYSVMDKSKFKETFGLEIPYWRESLKDCLENL